MDKIKFTTAIQVIDHITRLLLWLVLNNDMVFYCFLIIFKRGVY